MQKTMQAAIGVLATVFIVGAADSGDAVRQVEEQLHALDILVKEAVAHECKCEDDPEGCMAESLWYWIGPGDFQERISCYAALIVEHNEAHVMECVLEGNRTISHCYQNATCEDLADIEFECVDDDDDCEFSNELSNALAIECESGMLCGDGEDIPGWYICDGEEDCEDGTDEQGCI